MDLYPIELVWDELDRKIRARQPQLRLTLTTFAGKLSSVSGGKKAENLKSSDSGESLRIFLFFSLICI